MRIDKSVFSPEELAQYERLIAKAKVDPEAAKKEMEEEEPPFPPKKKKEEPPVEKTEKSDLPQFVKDAIAKSEEFIANAEKKEMADVAKKYEILGGKTEELADQLYNLKKSDPAMYNSCISMLDNQLGMIEKSGLFAEIGKSSGAYGGPVGAEAKVQAKASEIMKADPNITRVDAVAKAWRENPDLMAEYEAEYSR